MSAIPNYLETAIEAALAAGKLLRDNFGEVPEVQLLEAHDIKLELDTQTQHLIEGILLKAFPEHAILGEEGLAGNKDSDLEWIVDPLDGTVNYFYAIPHFCVSIALRKKASSSDQPTPAQPEILVGVVYDPMRDELWTACAEEGAVATLNGKPIQVSQRTRLGDAVVSVGLSKEKESITSSLPILSEMTTKVRKCRLMGSAALDLAYVASGRLDAYIEQGVNLWDIAAGVLLVQKAGGTVSLTLRHDKLNKYVTVATSNRIPELTHKLPHL